MGYLDNVAFAELDDLPLTRSPFRGETTARRAIRFLAGALACSQLAVWAEEEPPFRIPDHSLENANRILHAVQLLDLPEDVASRLFNTRGGIQRAAVAGIEMATLKTRGLARSQAYLEHEKTVARIRLDATRAMAEAWQHLEEKGLILGVKAMDENEVAATGTRRLWYYAVNFDYTPRGFFLVVLENATPLAVAFRMTGDIPADVQVAEVESSQCFFSLHDLDTFQETPLAEPGLLVSVPPRSQSVQIFSVKGSTTGPRDGRLRFAREGDPRGAEIDVPVTFVGLETRRVNLAFAEQGRNETTPCKVRLVDDRGFVYMPRSNEARGILRTSAGFFYHPGQVRDLVVPAADLRLTARRGLEHEEIRCDLPAGAEAQPSFRREFRRLHDMASEGWHSADLHLHAPQTQAPYPLNRAFGNGRPLGFYDGDYTSHVFRRDMIPWGGLVAAAEDLNLILPLIFTADGGTLNGELSWFQGMVTAQSSHSRHLVLVGEEYRHDGFGHLVLFGMKRFAFLDKRMNTLWPKFVAYPLNSQVAEQVMEEGGIVIQAHAPEAPSWQMEVPVLAALGRIHALEINYWSALKFWYRMLNTGIRVAPAMGTDAWVIDDRAAPGGGRTYIRTGPTWDVPALMEGIRRGRTFVTTGPLLLMKVNGNEPGDVISTDGDALDLEVDLRGYSLLPFGTVELVHNGKVIDSVEQTSAEKIFSRQRKLTITQGGWLAARCFNPELPFQCFQVLGRFAHTAPIYVEMPGKPVAAKEDAEYLVNYVTQRWADIEKNGIFDTEEQRAEAHGLYLEAIRKYADAARER